MFQTDGFDRDSDPCRTRTRSQGVTEIIMCCVTTGFFTMSGRVCDRSYCSTFSSRISLGVGAYAGVS